jgi:hypothetical protein
MTQKSFKNAALVLFLALFSAAVTAQEAVKKEEIVWKNAGFFKPRIEFIDTNRFYGKSKQLFTHTFDLTLVMFRETGWRKKVILKRLKKVADIYAQCGIKIEKIKYVTANAPDGMIDFSCPGYRDQKIAQRVPPTSKPILFYFRSIPELNAYAWVEHSDNEEIPDAIKNTAWFSLSVAMILNKKIRHPNYVSEAHELGHILLDSLDHAPEGVENLMAENYDHVNDQLTVKQCRKIKSHHLVTPLKKQ